MSNSENNPIRYFNGYLDRFGKAFNETILHRSDLSFDDKIAVIEALQEILQLHLENPEEKVSYKHIGNILSEKIIKPLRKQATPIYNAKIWQYFERESSCYIEYVSAETGKTSFTDEDFFDDEQYKHFLDRIYQVLNLSQTLLYLGSERPEDSGENDSEADKSGNKEFTLRRQILLLYYLDKVHHISNGADKTHFAKLAELLTGKNYKNVYDYIRNPFPDKASQRLVDDLKYIREYFIKLQNHQIIALIDKDIQVYR